MANLFLFPECEYKRIKGLQDKRWRRGTSEASKWWSSWTAAEICCRGGDLYIADVAIKGEDGLFVCLYLLCTNPPSSGAPDCAGLSKPCPNFVHACRWQRQMYGTYLARKPYLELGGCGCHLLILMDLEIWSAFPSSSSSSSSTLLSLTLF